MDSASFLNYHSQNISHPTFRSTKNGTSSRVTPSFSSPSASSLSSSSTFLSEDWPSSPATPLEFSGVPFSWEHLPGIPKKLTHKVKDSTSKVLPLPPPANSPASKGSNFGEVGTRKKASNGCFNGDPFLAALVECSKDDGTKGSNNHSFWSSPKVSRGVNDRFGFIGLHTSCQRTCNVAESIVYLPRPTSTSYNLFNRRSR